MVNDDSAIDYTNRNKKYLIELGIYNNSENPDGAERRVGGSHMPRTIIRHPSIIMAVSGGDPEAL